MFLFVTDVESKTKNVKQEWLLAFQDKILTHKNFKRTLFITENNSNTICKLFGVFPLIKLQTNTLQ